jgi:hypothetical protein
MRRVTSGEPVSGIMNSIHVCHALENGKEQNGIKNEDRKTERKMHNGKEKMEDKTMKWNKTGNVCIT